VLFNFSGADYMSDFLKAVKVTENVYWVGAIDWNVRNFHGYSTTFGTTYNAFLVIDEKITLIDTVKAPFFDEMMARISSVIEPEKIDYIVSNHAEMDHSGALISTLKVAKNAQLFASNLGEKALKAQLGADLPVTVVANGSKLNLGKGNLHFVETKMLHWPDSMFSYLDSEKVLFSQDAFGMHMAGSKRWHDEYSGYMLKTEATKYFANILLLQAPKIIDLLNTLPGLNLDIKVLAPDHGPMWRNDGIAYVLNLYRELAEQKPTRKAVVVYDTMWHATETMAKSVADGLMAGGLDVTVINMQVSDRSWVMTQLLTAVVIAVGSPTLNNNLFPSIADLLTYMRGLKPQNLIGGAFGAFGWSGEAVKQIGEYLTAMNIPQPVAPVRVKYVPAAADLTACFEFGKSLAANLNSAAC